MLLIVQCDARVPAGIYGELLRQRQVPHRSVRLFENDPLPALTEVSAAIILGGYMGVGDVEAYPYLLPLKSWMRHAADSGLPLLGICLGGQLLAEVTGGRVHSGHRGERGLVQLTLTEKGLGDPLFARLPSAFPVFEWHNDSFDVPPGGTRLAGTSACPGQVFRYRNAYGLQFHPEVDVAIVSAWAEAVGQPSHAEDYSRRADELRCLSLRLLENFLTQSHLF